jgi:leucyl aminopeptidase
MPPVTTASLQRTSIRKLDTEAVVIGLHAVDGSLVPAPGSEDIVDALGQDLPDTLDKLGASAKLGEVTKLPTRGEIKAPLLLVVGLGDQPAASVARRRPSASADTREDALERLRRASGAAARALSGQGKAAYALPASSPGQVRAIAEGALLGAYAFDRYLSKKAHPVREIVIVSDGARNKAMRESLRAATVVARHVNWARDQINLAPNDLYPESFAAEMQAHAKAHSVTATVLDERQLRRQGYGGILGVGQGSARPPRLVTLQYAPRKPVARLAFVGKGITFDSGGLSIKPSNAMATMKCDMSGAAAVAAAVYAVAELGLPVEVTAYACLAENMPSGSASRPGDVLTMYGGKTVEVLNTDAEGRLVLADGITTANATEPDLIVDVATLTGACQVALGQRVGGVLSNDESLLRELPLVAERAGELMWPLPIPEDVPDKLRTTKIADLSQHNPDAWGGALFAAGFLREFVAEGVPWAHLDIAGTAFHEAAPYGYTPKGGTGFGVRTLVQLAMERSATS